MEDQQQIEEMLKQGKINSEQAALLIAALRDSGKRQEDIFRQTRHQKRQRRSKIWGFVFLGLMLAVIVIIAFFLIGGRQGLSRNERKALSYLNQAGLAFDREEYLQAESYIQKGIQKDPLFPLNYSLLGLTQKLIYEQTGDQAYLRQAAEAFQTAATLQARQKGALAVGRIGVLFMAIFFLLFLGGILIVFMILYNLLAKREEHVNEAWAQVLTLYRRKLDLIPALMEAVKVYSQHEQQTLQSVVAERTKATEVLHMVSRDQAEPAELLTSQEALDSALGTLHALAERYPELKADVAYLTLQQQIESTEDQIARSRMRFNQSVNKYNTGLRLFPSNIIAGFFQFQQKGYFELHQV